MQLGLTAKTSMVVSSDDTAVAARSGDVPVLSTPRIVALCELLRDSFDNRAWDMALGIAVRTGFDGARGALAARQAIRLAEHGRIPRSNAASALATLFGKSASVLVSGT